MLQTEFQEEYLALHFRQQLAQWENYAEGTKHNLDQLDGQIYRLLKQSMHERLNPATAWSVDWRRVQKRGLVDKHPEVTRLRNRLDDWDNYGAGLMSGPSPSDYRRNLAAAMKADVLRLMSLREQLAKEQGDESYLALALGCDGYQVDQVVRVVTNYLEQHLAEARKLLLNHGFSWGNWFAHLDQLTSQPHTIEPEISARQLLRRLGLEEAWPSISLSVQSDSLVGYTGAIRVPSDVRILLRQPSSLHGLTVLFHELGHALGHALNRQAGLGQTWTAAQDEITAIVVEQVGLELMLDADQQLKARQASLLENVRCSLSFLFEVELAQKPERAEELYLKHYGQLGLSDCDPSVWCLDSFRSIDPAYIQNYVLGAVVAKDLLQQLYREHGDNHQQWGSWLKQNVLTLGRRRRFLLG